MPLRFCYPVEGAFYIFQVSKQLGSLDEKRLRKIKYKFLIDDEFTFTNVIPFHQIVYSSAEQSCNSA